MAIPRHILVLRFSALGDIAMTVPVLKNLLHQNPSLQITFVSVPFVKPLFDGIERLNFYPADIKKEYQGLSGIWKLSRQLRKHVAFDVVADLHDVLRTKILRLFLAKKYVVLDKGRKEKKELTRPVDKKLRPLTTGFQRYAAVFEQLGLLIHLNIEKGLKHVPPDGSLLPAKRNEDILIGVAPFARHRAKMYPLEKIKTLVELLLQKQQLQVFIFGTKNEITLLRHWQAMPGQLHFMAGKLNLEQELNVISQLDAMISMDSANMHLASLFGVPVISVWGGTHPFLGFYGWGQDYKNVVQTDLPCRPSSVFGDKNCPVHGTEGCMQHITPAMIYNKLMGVLRNQNLCC